MNDIQRTYAILNLFQGETKSSTEGRGANQSLPDGSIFVKRLDLMDRSETKPGASATAQVQSQTCTQVGTEKHEFLQ